MKGFLLIIDTREKDKKQLKRIKGFCDRNKIDFVIRKLEFGDYSFHIDGKNYENEFVLERKASWNELIGNLSKKDIGRFSREFEKADNCKVILFIEESKTNFEKWKYRSKIPPKVLGKKIRTFLNKYMIEMHLVRKVDTAKFIFKKIGEYLLGECDKMAKIKKKKYLKHTNKDGNIEVQFRVRMSRSSNYNLFWRDKFRFDSEENVELFMEDFNKAYKQFKIERV